MWLRNSVVSGCIFFFKSDELLAKVTQVLPQTCPFNLPFQTYIHSLRISLLKGIDSAYYSLDCCIIWTHLDMYLTAGTVNDQHLTPRIPIKGIWGSAGDVSEDQYY